MRFYEIEAEVEAILNDPECVDPETGELTPEADLRLSLLEKQRDEVMLYLATVVQGEKAEGEAVKRQADALRERAQIHANRAERLKGWIAQRLGVGTKLKDDRVSLGWRRSTTVEVDDVNRLPEECLRVTVTPDKTAIKDALKRGEKVEGAHLEDHQHLVIR